MPILTTRDGTRLAYCSYGPDDAALTVLLAHCWTSDQDDWRYQVRDLLQEFGHTIRIVTWDHRGHGLSDPAPYAACIVPNLAADMGELIDTVVPHGELVVAGHSIGGMATMALAESRPGLFGERIKAVVLVSTSCGGLRDLDLGLGEFGERVKDQIPRMLALRSRTLSKRLRRRTPVIERQIMSRLVFGKPQRLRDVALAVEGLVNCPGDTVAGFYEDMTLRHERFDALATIGTVPTRVLVGGADRLTPPRMARRLVEGLGGRTGRDVPLSVLPGAGHMLPLERDTEVSEAIAAAVRPLV